ncbi:MAG: inosine/xanthosine triphosphatase [Candidatus Sungbacteria bacterium]|nr:inosine/xanthosine triphosphatase [Candidatus Sungbacteria bacterium]
MKKIIVASTNPVKIAAARAGFVSMFPGEPVEVRGISVTSGVSDQPRSDAEVFQGAWNRAHGASSAAMDCDFAIGIEGGVEDKHDGMEAFAWTVVRSRHGVCGRARTGAFLLPPRVAELIRQGKELGEADDIVFGRTNSKQENGAIGILTDNAIDRAKFYADAVALAFIPFKNEHLYKPSIDEK